MRTNIILNDELVREAMRYARARTKTGLVEEALRAFVELRSAEERSKSYQERLATVQRTLSQGRFRESAVDILRQDRERG